MALGEDLRTFSEPIFHGDAFDHMVQDHDGIDYIEQKELPQPQYKQLKQALRDRAPGADLELVDHAVALVAAFDTATAYDMSLGSASFAA